MGRGGGGGGGGSHSFGGGGGHSFGGSSSHSSRGGSSSHSSRSYNSGPRVSHTYHNPGPRVTHHYHHYGPSYRYGRSVYVGGGWGSVMSTVIVIFMIAVILIAISGNIGGVTKSTVEREPLKPYASFNKNAYDDDAGWIHDKKALQKGMESFYKQTGIQPALAIYEDIDGEKYLSDSKIEDFMYEEYDRLIGHERGLLLLFCEYADSDWYAYYMAGEDAQTVMDSEASEILMDYVHDLYTNDSYSDEEFFGAVFSKTADRIMTVTPTVASRIPLIVGAVLVIAVLAIGLNVVKEKHRRDAEKAKETERILQSPIDRL